MTTYAKPFPKITTYDLLEGPMVDKYVRPDPTTDRLSQNINAIAASIPGLQACTPQHIIIVRFLQDVGVVLPFVIKEYKNTICSAAQVTLPVEEENSVFDITIPLSQQLQQIDPSNTSEDRAHVFSPLFVEATTSIYVGENQTQVQCYVTNTTTNGLWKTTVTLKSEGANYDGVVDDTIMIKYYCSGA